MLASGSTGRSCCQALNGRCRTRRCACRPVVTEGGTTFSCLAYLEPHLEHLPATTSSDWWLLPEYHNSLTCWSLTTKLANESVISARSAHKKIKPGAIFLESAHQLSCFLIRSSPLRQPFRVPPAYVRDAAASYRRWANGGPPGGSCCRISSLVSRTSHENIEAGLRAVGGGGALLWLQVRRCRFSFSYRKVLYSGGVDVLEATVVAVRCARWRPLPLLLVAPLLGSSIVPRAPRKHVSIFLFSSLLLSRRVSPKLIFTATAGYYFFNALRVWSPRPPRLNTVSCRFRPPPPSIVVGSGMEPSPILAHWRAPDVGWESASLSSGNRSGGGRLIAADRQSQLCLGWKRRN